MRFEQGEALSPPLRQILGAVACGSGSIESIVAAHPSRNEGRVREMLQQALGLGLIEQTGSGYKLSESGYVHANR